MTQRLQVYKCDVCGNMVEVIHASGGTLSCCGQDMTLMTENTTDAAKEKHVPVVEKTDEGVMVKVGEIAHPMEEKHHIEWVQVIVDDNACRHFFKPGDKPEALFRVNGDSISAREFCNLHGLWRK
ncbi:MAG: desulfoferrodoxin [Pseudomonadota bacterium]